MQKIRLGEISGLGNLVVVLTLFLVVAWQLPKFDFFNEPAPYVHLHSILEAASILASLALALLALSHQSDQRNNYLVMLGSCFLAVSLIDIFHTLSYQGMPDFFGPSNPEKAINFWLAARFFSAIALVLIAVIKADHWAGAKRYGFMAASAALVVLVFVVGFITPEILPRTFIAGQGLTPLKIALELLIFGLFGLATLMLMRRTAQPSADRQSINFAMLAAGAWVLGLAELFFTLYGSVTDIFNLLGHVYKIIGTVMVLASLKDLRQKRPDRA